MFRLDQLASRLVHLGADIEESLLVGDQPAADSTLTAVWGGASIGRLVDMIIDVHSAKQGKLLPGICLDVQGPTAGLSRLTAGATIFVVHSNYLPEIREMSKSTYRYIGVDHG